MVNTAHWHTHVLKTEQDQAMQNVLEFQVEVKGRKGERKIRKEESMKVDVSMKNMLCQLKWIVGFNVIVAR